MMNWRSTAHHWGIIAKTFHWLVALGIFALAGIGLYMVDMPLGMAQLKVYLLHKALGVTVLALVLLRLLWRLFDRHPHYPADMPRWQVGAAHASHALLYLLLLLLPISGWVYNSASGFPLPWFGLLNRAPSKLVPKPSVLPGCSAQLCACAAGASSVASSIANAAVERLCKRFMGYLLGYSMRGCGSATAACARAPCRDAGSDDPAPP